MSRLAPALVLLLAACSQPGIYGAGQAWQRNECQKLADAQERSRCLASNSRSYEEYRRQREAARGSD